MYTLVGRVYVCWWRVHDASDDYNFGTVFPEEREEHGYRLETSSIYATLLFNYFKYHMNFVTAYKIALRRGGAEDKLQHPYRPRPANNLLRGCRDFYCYLLHFDGMNC